MPGARKTRRSGTDDKDPFAGIPARLNGPFLLDGEITQKALDSVDGHGFIKIFSITTRLARMITGPAVRARQWLQWLQSTT